MLYYIRRSHSFARGLRVRVCVRVRVAALIICATFVLKGLHFASIHHTGTKEIAQSKLLMVQVEHEQQQHHQVLAETSPAVPIKTNQTQSVAPLPPQIETHHLHTNAHAHPFERLEKQQTADPIMNAVVHIGPHKTGTTAIQQYSTQLIHQLAKDNYEMPWSHLNSILQTSQTFDTNHPLRGHAVPNQVSFATCFLQTNNPLKMNAFMTKNTTVKDVFPCRKDLLQSGHHISQQNHSLFVSAETFDHLNIDGVAALSEYLRPWSNVTIVASYRRYYDWLISYHNQLSKGDSVEVFQKNSTDKLRPSIYDALCDSHWLETVQSKYTLFIVARFKRHFPNVVIMNVHDENVHLVEQFYCNVLPHAPNTCEAVRKEEIQQSKKSNEDNYNKSGPLVYQDLAYAAHRRGIINIQTQKQYVWVQNVIQDYQEDILKLSSSDFRRRCPPQHVLDQLLDISLQAERELLVSDFSASTKNELKDDFEIRSKSSLCEVDMAATLEMSVWEEFFKSLQQKLLVVG